MNTAQSTKAYYLKPTALQDLCYSSLKFLQLPYTVRMNRKDPDQSAKFMSNIYKP